MQYTAFTSLLDAIFYTSSNILSINISLLNFYKYAITK